MYHASLSQADSANYGIRFVVSKFFCFFFFLGGGSKLGVYFWSHIKNSKLEHYKGVPKNQSVQINPIMGTWLCLYV